MAVVLVLSLPVSKVWKGKRCGPILFGGKESIYLDSETGQLAALG